MEEDIKFIKYYINEYIAVEDIGIEDDFKFQEVIEQLIKEYKNLKEIEENHRQENGELRERVKQLEEKLDETLNANLALVQGNANSIPVYSVKEKIKEYFEDEEWLVEHDLRALYDDEKECREYYTNKKIALKDIKKAILDKLNKLLKNY